MMLASSVLSSRGDILVKNIGLVKSRLMKELCLYEEAGAACESKRQTEAASLKAYDPKGHFDLALPGNTVTIKPTL